ncbi:hypothetical protein D8674_040341 [Pyrus ussuriensis x Pyrus communis]|uniref:Uncharacterized protein n=1 Tax=Pyrus ussuriensis x Pyrus communis TaxID=2448454 RepID=A0A5N5FWK6_9ROSA|nr:hypothetical protein D8674_007216 [Pyrus ussuriensis x Pyrus communis]KAB2619756.1 hypothetical protein D8674_040341 [Pyrus ussuriensis x Pyrus communis]
MGQKLKKCVSQVFFLLSSALYTPHSTRVTAKRLFTLCTLHYLLMASASRSSSWLFSLSENWLPMATIILVCGFVGYTVYDAVMATVSELLQRLLVISPLLIVIVVHWLSTGSQVNIGIPGSEPGAIHRAGGSPWGVAFLLFLLFFLISYQPSLHGLLF